MVETFTSLDKFPASSIAFTTKLLAESAVRFMLKLQALLLTVAEPKEVELSAVPSLFASAYA